VFLSILFSASPCAFVSLFFTSPYAFFSHGSIKNDLSSLALGIVHPNEHFGADGDWRSISIYTVRLPNATIVAVAKCKQANKNYGAKVIAGCNTPMTNSKKNDFRLWFKFMPFDHEIL
jgi:hypothetical protein